VIIITLWWFDYYQLNYKWCSLVIFVKYFASLINILLPLILNTRKCNINMVACYLALCIWHLTFWSQNWKVELDTRHNILLLLWSLMTRAQRIGLDDSLVSTTYRFTHFESIFDLVCPFIDQSSLALAVNGW